MNKNVVMPKGAKVSRLQIITISLDHPRTHMKNEELNLLDQQKKVIGIGRVLETRTGTMHRVMVVA